MASKLRKFMALLQSFREYGAEYLNKKLFNKSLPVTPLHDDLYLVSFPKSGTTWLNFLMANIHLRMSGSSQQVTFYNINDFIPDIEQVRNLKANILIFPGYRVIKSHSEFNPFYNKVIYLIRDPRDIMVSYYYFLKNLGAFKKGLSQLIHSPRYGIRAWCRHVQGWVEKTPASTSIDFIRYEDMKAGPRQVLTRIYNLLGHMIPEEVMAQAIQASSFENMKKLETEYNYGGDFRFPGFEFMRKGESGTYKEEISKEDLDFITATAAPWLIRFGYSPSPE
jgi:hypothetical protein